MLFKEIIADLRKSNGMTEKALAAALHVSDSTVRNWEKGRSGAGIETLIQIADYFKVTIDYLVGRDNNIFATYQNTNIHLNNVEGKIVLRLKKMTEEQLKKANAATEKILVE